MMNRAEDASREGRRRERRKRFDRERKREQTLGPPSRDLNPDQLAVRRVLEHDFFGNRSFMADEVGMSPSWIWKYTHAANSTPKWEHMELIADAIGLSVDQLRFEGRTGTHGVFLIGQNRLIDPDRGELTAEVVQDVLEELRRSRRGRDGDDL